MIRSADEATINQEKWPTNYLRWSKAGTLQQQWLDPSNSEAEWRDVPREVESVREWVEVESSHLSAVRFESGAFAGTQPQPYMDWGSLFVRFKSGEVYKFQPITRAFYDELLEAESKGKFFIENIKNSFQYEKVEDGHN